MIAPPNKRGAVRQEKSWHVFFLQVPTAMADDIAAEFFELASCGVQLEEDEEDVCLTVYFPDDIDKTLLERQIQQILSQAGLTDASLKPLVSEQVKDQDWNAQWRRFFKPIWISEDLGVRPSWMPLDIKEGQIEIIIDPKRAFGTGGHESTRLALLALKQLLRPEEQCLDLGTGSGILAIAALKLGARSVDGIDTDIDAVENAQENLEINGVAEKARVLHGGIEQVQQNRYGLVMANITCRVLRSLLKDIFAVLKADGYIIFSGLLVKFQDAFCGAVNRAGLSVVQTQVEGEWLCVVARRA